MWNTTRQETDPQVDVQTATEDQSMVIANLFELYAYDFSEFHDMEIGSDGRFGFGNRTLFWSEPNRHPLLLRHRQKLVGFALLKKGSEITKREDVWDMAEFFILRRYRRRGVGTEAARQIWTRFLGQWEVRVIGSNDVARRFWAQAVETLLGKAPTPVLVEIAGRDWYVFSFDSAATTDNG